MSQEYFSKDFAHKFRQEYALYTPMEEYQHGNLLFRQVAGMPDEIEALAISVTQKLFHAPLIYRLMNKLEKEDIGQVIDLCTVVKSLRDEFHTYGKNEPYTSAYYNDLIAMLDSFHELANTLKKEVCEPASDTLKKAYARLLAKGSGFAPDYTYPYNMAEEIGYYLKNMLVYYNHFVFMWQNERDNKKGIRLTTQVAEHLAELICLIEQVVSGMEDTLDLFLTWEVQKDMLDDQALFN